MKKNHEKTEEKKSKNNHSRSRVKIENSTQKKLVIQQSR
jgi:hypothetical protein